MSNIQITPIDTVAGYTRRTAAQNIRKNAAGTTAIKSLPVIPEYKTPEQMLKVIAIAVNMNVRCFSMRSRRREVVELRYVGALLLRSHFCRITLQQVAALFGGQDHTSVMHGMITARNLLQTGDAKFTKKYQAARQAITVWLNKQGTLIKNI